MNIEFQTDEQFDNRSLSVQFTAQNGKKEIACRVSYEMLSRYYGAGNEGDEALKIFREHRETFERIAAEKIKCGDVERDRRGLFAKVISSDYFSACTQ